MPDTTRTFLAVAVPATLERKLARLQGQLAEDAPGFRWDVALPYHVTLAFLGEVDHSDLNKVCLAVAEAAAPFERFELTLEGIGAFPTAERPRVVWAGIGGPGVETLGALQAAVTDAALRQNCRPDTRPFHPHVTLGRARPGRQPGFDFSRVVSHYRTWHAGPFLISEAVTFGSSMTREGPSYSPLGRAPLKGRKAAPSA